MRALLVPTAARHHVGPLATAALLAGGAAAACARAATEAPPTTLAAAASPALRALEVTVEPAAPTVVTGDTLAVRVQVVNRSDTPITVGGSGSCTVLLEVHDASGALVEPSRGRVCTLDCRSYTFAPGRPYVLDARFTARNWSNDEQRFVTLPRGTYQLVGLVTGALGRCDGADVHARSAPALVRLL